MAVVATRKKRTVKRTVKKATKAPIKRRTATKVTKTTVKKRRTTKGKPRGASGGAKYVGKYLKALWADAKARGKKPTKAELSTAMKKGWAEWKKTQ